MIATLTLNPAIDLNIEVGAFSFSQPMRAQRERKRAGGKGINVSAVLDILGRETAAYTLLGGPGGDEFRALAEAHCRFPIHSAPSAANTRTNIVITSTSDNRHLKVNQRGGDVTEAELNALLEKLGKALQPGDWLVLAGSIPPGLPEQVYADAATRFGQAGVRVALDADGAALREGLRGKPRLLKPNREELEGWCGKPLNAEDQLLRAAREVLETGCEICLVTSGSGPAYMVSRSISLRGIPPRAEGSPVGSGDAFLAGMLAGLVTGSDDSLESAFRLAIACGSSAASTPDTEFFRPEILKTYLEKVSVEIL